MRRPQTTPQKRTNRAAKPKPDRFARFMDELVAAARIKAEAKMREKHQEHGRLANELFALIVASYERIDGTRAPMSPDAVARLEVQVWHACWQFYEVTGTKKTHGD